MLAANETKEATVEKNVSETTNDATKTQKKSKRGRPKGSKNKKPTKHSQETQKKSKRGRPKGSKNKKPTKGSQELKTSKELIKFIKEEKNKLRIGKSAASKVIRSTAEELCNTTNKKREKELVNQILELKELAN